MKLNTVTLAIITKLGGLAIKLATGSPNQLVERDAKTRERIHDRRQNSTVLNQNKLPNRIPFTKLSK